MIMEKKGMVKDTMKRPNFKDEEHEGSPTSYSISMERYCNQLQGQISDLQGEIRGIKANLPPGPPSNPPSKPNDHPVA